MREVTLMPLTADKALSDAGGAVKQAYQLLMDAELRSITN